MAHEPVTALAVAEELLRLARDEQRPLTPLKLIKLTYLCHGWSLALMGCDLLSEEVEAWQYGPVIPELYHAIKHFRSGEVTALPYSGGAKLDDDQKQLVASVYDAYKALSGGQLSSLTHESGTPWHDAWTNRGKNAVIPTNQIREHFERLAA